MQDVKDIMIHQILAEFLGTGDMKEATERLQLCSTTHNQKVIGVVLKATEKHVLPGEVIISTLENEAAVTKNLNGESRQLWEKIGLAYSGPDQELPRDMIYMDGGLYVNCSDDLLLGVYPATEELSTPCITLGSDEEPGLLSLAFPNKENLLQLIDVLKGLADTMESTPCSPSTDA